MQSIELTKPITTEALLKEFESRFNQTLNLSKFSREQLEDTANKIRTKIHNITQNEHFGQELRNHDYQKNQAMLDVVNQRINNEYKGFTANLVKEAFNWDDNFMKKAPRGTSEIICCFMDLLSKSSNF